MHNVQTGATMNDNSNRPPNDYDRPVNGNGPGQQQSQQQPAGNGVDFMAILNGLLAAGNRRRLVLRHRGETVLRLPLTIAAAVGLIMLWQSAFLLVAVVALILFLQVSVSLERRVDTPPPPHGYRD